MKPLLVAMVVLAFLLLGVAVFVWRVLRLLHTDERHTGE